VIATHRQLVELAGELGVGLPTYFEYPWDADHPVTPPQVEHLLARAQSDVEVLACGVRFSDELVAALDDDQVLALGRAICVQALWIQELDDGEEWIGPSDIQSLPEGITFSRDSRPRISPAVLQTIALRDLIHYSGMARPTVASVEPLPPDPPWWWT
jgi:hypothetical protein